MPEFTLNLIRDSVMPPARRRTRYWGMVAYLAASGLALAVVLGLATSWMTQTTTVREETISLERDFLRTHPGRAGIETHAVQQERAMGECVTRLKAVEVLLKGAPRPAQVLYPLVVSLPAGISIRSLVMDAAGQTVSFELLVISRGAEADVDPSGLMAHWSQDAVLKKHLRGITYLGGRRQSSGERSDMVWRFSGRLATGDS